MKKNIPDKLILMYYMHNTLMWSIYDKINPKPNPSKMNYLKMYVIYFIDFMMNKVL